MREFLVIDILIINYNASQHLQTLLDALIRSPKQAASRHADFVITVVDNASTDDSASMIESRFPRVRLIKRENNDGYSAAVNEGIAATTNREILLLNSDIIITPNQLASLGRIWEREDFPGVLGPLHLEEDGFPQLTWGAFPTTKAERRRRRLERGLNRREPWARRQAMIEASRTREVDWLSGSCLFFSRSAARHIGPWDENFFLYFEDIDWCLRARDKGFRVTHTPEVQVKHIHGASMELDPDSSEIEYRASQCYFTRKRFGRWAFFKLRVYLTAKMLGRLFLGGWSGFSRGASWEILTNLWRTPSE